MSTTTKPGFPLTFTSGAKADAGTKVGWTASNAGAVPARSATSENVRAGIRAMSWTPRSISRRAWSATVGKVNAVVGMGGQRNVPTREFLRWPLIRDERDLDSLGEHQVHAAPRISALQLPPVPGACGVLGEENITRL